MSQHLSLSDLETHDPHSTGTVNRRYLCPLPACADHQDPHRHRSLLANAENGAWRCFRCGAAGKLVDHWEERPARPSHRVRSTAFRPAPVREPSTPPIDTNAVTVPIAEVPEGLAYLKRRGIPGRLAMAAGLRFSPTWGASAKWAGAPSVVFPLRDEHEITVAGAGRAIRGDTKLTLGPKSTALFRTPGAGDAPAFGICEAPIDALSLAVAGLPSVALCGTTEPTWLRRHVLGRLVLLATDADRAGDEAAARLSPILTSLGGRVLRLAPPTGTKDWNEALVRHGVDAVRQLVAGTLSHAAHPADVRALLDDPRAVDYPEDAPAWRALFAAALAWRGPMADPLHALRACRMCGARLERTDDAYRIEPGADLDAAEFGLIRAEWLMPNGEAITHLVNRSAGIPDGSARATPSS